jgi:nucleosome assembly protein 1-like 1
LKLLQRFFHTKMSQEQDLTPDGGVKKLITKQGEGEECPPAGSVVEMHYVGKLKSNNKQFDSSIERGKTFEFVLGEGEVIKGWDVAVATMKKGEKATLTLKPEYGYGKRGAGDDIPPNATLVFDVELIGWKKAMTLAEMAEKELIESTPPIVVNRIRVLQHLHVQHEEIENQESKEIAEITKKYQALFTPLYARRAEIINGTKDVTEEEVKSATEKYAIEGAQAANEVKGIPSFWLQVLKNSEFGEDLVQPHDEEALKALENITVETTHDEDGNETTVTVTFHFGPNEYFENNILTRTFELEDDEVKKTTATPIKWKTGKNLSVKIVEKKQRKKGGNKNQTRVIRKEEPQETFFSFFNDPVNANAENDEDGDYEAQALADQNWGIAQIIRDDLITNAVNYYLNLVPREEYSDEEGGDDEEGFEDEDEDE